jgi:hypothetical protein
MNILNSDFTPVIETEGLRLDRIEELARRIEAVPKENTNRYSDHRPEVFNMNRFFRPMTQPEVSCHTASCLAGWTIAMFGTKEDKRKAGDPDNYICDTGVIAAELLGIHNINVWMSLFIPNLNLRVLTPQQGARALRRLATGAESQQELWGEE